jgi:hypothetical protein
LKPQSMSSAPVPRCDGNDDDDDECSQDRPQNCGDSPSDSTGA